MGAEPVRVAIAGAGVGAEHLQGYEERGDEFEVAWLCDLDQKRAAAVAAGRAGIRIAADLREVLADEGVGLVDICLPPHLHCEAALAALAAGKHVVCEKPLCLALADADRLAAAEREHGRRVYPVFQYRFNHGPRLLRRLAASGRAGRLLLAAAQTHWNRLPAYYDASFRGRWATDGVGAAGIHAIHVHDLVASCLGPVRSVYARLDLCVNPIETDDTAALVMEMAGGGLFSSSTTLGAASDYSQLHVSFAHLAVDSGRDPQLREDWRLTPRGKQGEELIASLGEERPPAGFAGLFAEIAKDLRGEASEAVRLADARASIELLTAVYASHARNAPATLPCAPDDPLYQGWRDAHGVRPREA